MPDWEVQGATNTTGSPLIRGGFAVVGESDVFAPEPEPTPDTTAPVVGDYDPPANADLSPTGTISFSVTDESGVFCSIMITMAYPDGSWEVVHTGTAFAPRFAAGSGRSVIADGFRYTLRRAGGWHAVPTIHAFVVDAAGNAST